MDESEPIGSRKWRGCRELGNRTSTTARRAIHSKQQSFRYDVHVQGVVAAEHEAVDELEALILGEQLQVLRAALELEDASIGRIRREDRAVVRDRDVVAHGGWWRKGIAAFFSTRPQVERDQRRDADGRWISERVRRRARPQR